MSVPVPPGPWRIWLSGASSGIGAALALELASRGHGLALFARRRDRLESVAAEVRERTAGAVVLVQEGDVRDRERVFAAVGEARRELGGLDVLILNAGIGDTMSPDRFDTELFERTTAVNYLGAVYGVAAGLPGFLADGRGCIVGVSSIAAVRGLPGAAPYCASKSALTSFLESMRNELRPRGVGVITVSPGFVKTPLTDRNRFPMPFLLSPEVAARRIVDGIERGRSDIHFPRRLTVPMRLLRGAPTWFFDWVVRRLFLGRGFAKRPGPSVDSQE